MLPLPFEATRAIRAGFFMRGARASRRGSGLFDVGVALAPDVAYAYDVVAPGRAHDDPRIVAFRGGLADEVATTRT
ncbi:hypothetical protein ACVK00_004434 [Burkholderia sp. PvR073]|uniref:hypothetical protein n=1 Tax=Burkholderia sp. B21-005 TaxID=2890406 RepID=UPI001E51CEA5|nr:hypothetical protein [Burkholderia sp. B21-005]UEP40174.1 hypothetical protein LMA02_09970 [Burkholderia sp. B21-005]